MAVPNPALPEALDPAADEQARPSLDRSGQLSPTTSSPTLDFSRHVSVTGHEDEAGAEVSTDCPSSSTSVASFATATGRQTTILRTKGERDPVDDVYSRPSRSPATVHTFRGERVDDDDDDDEKSGGGGLGKESRGDAEAQRPAPPADEDEWTYPDGGYQAWATTIGCFIYAGTTMGFGLTWGVFQSYYVTQTFEGTDESVITLVGGLAAFTMNATCFFGGRLGDRYGYKRMLTIGSGMSFLSFFLMAWGTEHLWSVFLLQGFLNGLCLGFCMPIAMALPSQWFLKRRGLATGIATSGSGLIGGVMSLLVRLMIVRIGPRYTLLVVTAIHGVFYVVAFFLVAVRERPISRGPDGRPNSRPWLPRGVWRTLSWYSFTLSVFVGVFGFLPPYFFITSYTKDTIPALADSTSLKVSVPLIVMNIAGGLGRIAIGQVADKIGPVNSFFLALLIGGLVQVCVWQFAHTFPSIMGFAVLFGTFGGLFMSLLPVVAAQLFGSNPDLPLATIVGFATLCNSPGQFAAGSVGGVLRETFGWRALILFSGLTMAGGSTLILYARFHLNPKIWAKV